MSLSYDTFERYRDKGLEARKLGQWESARLYLLEASRAMVLLAREETSERLKEARQDTALRLLELARDCEARKHEPPPPAKRPAPRSGKFATGQASATRDNSPSGDSDPETDGTNFLVREKPTVRFDDIAGLDAVKNEIRLRMIYPLEHPELAEQFQVRAGGGVLLYGPPGTGKTLLARATACELDAAFFVVSPADILSKWVGEAEQNVQKLFTAAVKHAPSVIFIDEIESLIPSRSDDGGGGGGGGGGGAGGVMQRVVPQILQGMEGFSKDKSHAGVMFMGATNVPWQLDSAVLRPGRFDAKVYIPLPDLPARRRMLDLYLGKRPVADNVDLDALATRLEGYSGADIKYLCDRAATIPFLEAVARHRQSPPQSPPSPGPDPTNEITPETIAQALNEVRPSVHPDHLRRFEQWSKENA